MKLEEQDIVRFDNDKEYVIVKILTYNNVRYFYFAALNKSVNPQYVIMKEAKEQGKFTFSKLEEEEFELVKDKFALDTSN